MNLRTKGLLLSVLPLALTLLVAAPEVVVQIQASQDAARASHNGYLSRVARRIEDSTLDLIFATRRLNSPDPRVAAEYARDTHSLKADVTLLEELVTTSRGRRAADEVNASVTAYLNLVSATVRSARSKPPSAAAELLNRGTFALAANRVRKATREFDDGAQESELRALAALDRLWKSSLAFLVLAVLVIVAMSAFLFRYTGHIVRGVLELGQKTERYRRGDVLGELIPRNDEIGDLHRALHEFVTERQQRERLLERYRLLAQVTDDIILFIDRADLTIVDANAAAIRAYGYADLIGMPTASLHAADDPNDSETLARSDRPEGLSYEGSHQRADGSVFPVEVHARTADVEGRLTIVKTIRDISERRQAAQQVSDAVQRYRLLADTTRDKILFIDRLDLTIVDANAAALAGYGYERGGLIGQPIETLWPTDDASHPEVRAAIDSPAGSRHERLHRRSDGTLFPVEVYANTADVAGRLTIIATVRDISERRQAAEQIALALDHAVEASRLKSEFVATMSHEIRTPMHGVIGMSELLLETQLLPLQREYAATVKESAQALLAIIDDILDFSKLEANKIALENVAFDPLQLVARTINLVRATARDKGLALHSVASQHVPAAVRGDPTRLRQVLINLIGNAVKFTSAGEVLVSTLVDHDEGRTIVLSFAVRDTGIGVSPEARGHLFEAFVQGDGSTTRRFGGTGLGLSISRRLVELMGGRIWLEEHEGPGATFCFTARFERTSEIVAPIAIAATNLRVLILDDDLTTRQILESNLTEWGMQSASSEDIDSARAELRAAARDGAPFDVVLIDYVLPRSDGLAFAAEIGEHSEYGNPARVLITAFDAVGRKESALASGCAAYLCKPIDPSELYNILGDIERRRRSRIVGADNGTRSARILMAEDSALIRRVARLQLEELEYAVDIVEDGQQAVDALASGDYQLVLMDMRMPEMDGLDATRAIREAERTSGRHVVIIALTANVLEGDREACIAAGMDDFLTKPLKLDALRAALARWLPGPS